MTRIGHWLTRAGSGTVTVMQVIGAKGPSVRVGPVVASVALGAAWVATGLAMAYLVVQTPLVSRLAPAGGSASPGLALAVWAFGLVAGGALVVAGADRLATTLAGLRASRPARTAVARSLPPGSTDIVVATGVVPGDGRPIQEVVVGPFGVAVVAELEGGAGLRRMGHGWEAATADGWRSAEDPLDRASRDAERVRRWFLARDLDFVVRVYAAVVAADLVLPRSATCAVITEEQIPAWLASLPPQRSLSTARRGRLVALLREAVPA